MIFYPRPLPIDAYQWFPTGPHPDPNPVHFDCKRGYFIVDAETGYAKPISAGVWLYREEHAPDVLLVMENEEFKRRYQALIDFDPIVLMMRQAGQNATQPLQLERFGKE